MQGLAQGWVHRLNSVTGEEKDRLGGHSVSYINVKIYRVFTEIK